MTVRWKPLIVLSGLFLIIAAFGLLAITLDAGTSGTKEVLVRARAEWKAGRRDNAQIHFQRALQKDPRDAKVHEELARLYSDWSDHEPSQRAKLRAERVAALVDAAKYGKAPEPRRQLLLDALVHGDTAQAATWAKKLIEVDAQAPDAHYALAVAELEGRNPVVERVEPHLAMLDSQEPSRPRTVWLQARLAETTGDTAARGPILARSRSLSLDAGADATDRAALLRLRGLDALDATDPGELAARCSALADEARSQSEDEAAGPDSLVAVGRQLGSVLRHVGQVRSSGDEAARAALAPSDEALGGLAESCFQRAVKDASSADLRIDEEYAEHLLGRDDRARCLEVIGRALKRPAAALPAWNETVMRLREVAIKAALLDVGDPQRFERAEPHIQALLKSSAPVQQAIGHLFQGVVELDRSGLAADAGGARSSTGMDARLRSSALGHLKVAAAGLPDVATAQALYGVALLLTDEPALGRQYLLGARRLPNLEPRYKLWCAWAMVQAGYPEEAEPDVHDLLAAVEAGRLGKDIEPSLRLLVAEIHQSRRSPDDLRKARDAYAAAIAAGQPATAGLELRLAQIDVMLGEPEEGLGRIQSLRQRGEGGPAAETLAVMILSDQKKEGEARRVLDAARKVYPDSGELVALEASLHYEKEPERADRVLAEFLAAHPKDLDVLQLRARLLADALKRPDEARALLVSVADSVETSSPLVQLALIDLARGDHPAVAATIARIRGRWKEAAAADLLDAQLALAKQDPRAALAHLDTALKKDPSNKLALFWKAQLDNRAGSPAEAEKTYEAIAKGNPVKELDEGLSLATAADWALATMELENQKADAAITRLERLLESRLEGNMARPVRWQLVAARASAGQWPAARKELQSLMASGLSTEESIRAANFFRLHDEPAVADNILDGVLKHEPGNSAALAIRAFMLAEKQPNLAAEQIRKGIAAGEQPPSLYLMLAAIENMMPPAPEGLRRALGVVEEGLKAHADSIELVQAKYRLTGMAGDAKAALTYVESRAKDDPKGQYRRLLVDIHRDAQHYEQAETIVRALMKETPKDPKLAATLVQMVAARAVDSGRRGDRAAETALNQETAGLVRRFRSEFPNDPVFLQAEAELAARGGQLDRALAVSREIDALDGASPLGPELRARIAAARGWSQGVAQEYAEAVARAPRRVDLRLALGESSLAVGRVDDALKQAEWLLQADSDGPAALLLKARALARQGGTPDQARTHRAEAVATLRQAVADRPKFAAGYHLLAELQLEDGQRAEAIQTLRSGLEAMPDDHAGSALLIQALCEPRPDGTPAPTEALREAEALADRLAKDESAGEAALAVAMGFHKAGQLDRAAPWAERAARRLDTWVAHLAYGDLLLAQAETLTDRAETRRLFEQADGEYAKVLATQADSVEAVNNRAWVLHQYLDRAAEALALCEGLARRVDASTLPPDFYDTLGSVREALHHPREAEAAYGEGLKRAPEHPILNYHLGRLLAADPARAATARGYLEKAKAGGAALPPAMAADLETLVGRLGE